ncbi:hypothetical protein Tco_1226911 [Tanacetum coccineum]
MMMRVQRLTSQLETVVNVVLSHTQEKSLSSFNTYSRRSNISSTNKNKVNKILEALLLLFIVQKQRRNIIRTFINVDAMQEELLQFEIQKVWILVDLPYRKKAIGKIDEEVYVSQPPGFLDPKYPEKVNKMLNSVRVASSSQAWYAYFIIHFHVEEMEIRRGTRLTNSLPEEDKHDII